MPLQKNSKPIPTIAFDRCTMSPAGVMALAEHLHTQPLLRNVEDTRLEAMAIAYLAWGGSTDNNHAVQYSGLHRAHSEAHLNSTVLNWRDDLRPSYRSAVMDMLTWLDRMSGGGTLLMHAPGTRPPGSPAFTEEVKLDVFLPLNAVRTEPYCRIAVAHIIQHYAEHVGVSVMQIWDRAKILHFGMHAQSSGAQNPTGRNAKQPVLPPVTAPALVFFGRAPGTFEPLLEQEVGDFIGQPIVPPAPPATPAPAPPATPAPAPPATPTPDSTVPTPGSSSSSRGAASSRSPDKAVKAYTLADIARLEGRILELQRVIETQGEEISNLRDIIAAREVPSRPPHHAPYTSDSASSSTGTFGGGKGKESSARSGFPTSPSLRSLSVSSVSSVTPSSGTPSQSPTPYSRRHAQSPSGMLANMTLAHSGHESSGPSRSQPAELDGGDSEGGDEGLRYGYYTDHAVAAYGLPDSTFRQLHTVYTNYDITSWSAGVIIQVGVSKHIAEYIANAMRKDYRAAKAAV